MSVYANAFGGQFPVCNEDQKVRMEEAYKSAGEYADSHAPMPDGCYCDLIIALLSPDTSRTHAIVAGIELAKHIVAREGVANMLQSLQLASMPIEGKAN